MLKLTPDYYFNKFSDASVDFLLSIGVKGVLMDVDNTLEPYENPVPGEDVLAWISSLKAAGIGCAIVSNNNGERIKLFNSELSLPAYYKAKKPFSKNLKRALRDISVKKEEAIFIGDQIFTDVLAARFSGIRAILVPPIKDKTDLFTRFKRLLERPVLKRYNKLHKNKEE
ncbi:MAG: YqeG family HAD IIIA-type phosphatase [Clostridia bacterium]|nr:YqeG family HAD IIIA-type phosphatase [Clostridia bacterium]